MSVMPYAQHAVRVEAMLQHDALAGADDTATILLAEDDDAVRALLVRVLRLRGYSVVVAVDGAEAVAVAMSYGRPFQLLITDVMMPKMDGLALAAQLLSSGLAQRVIYMTGYADALLDAQGEATVLHKPFTPSTLAEAVRAALSR